MNLTAQDFAETLDGALLVLHDRNTGVLFCWFGGTGINGYLPDCEGNWSEVIYYNMAGVHPDREDALRSIEEHMQLEGDDYWY